jgi:hypothetical protein
MGFDDEYYTSSTPEEINQFYQKYCTISNDDIPDADEVRIYDDEPTSVKNVNVENTEIKAPLNDLDDLNDLTSDPDNIGLTDVVSSNQSTSTNNNDDIDADQLIAGLDI